MATVTLNNHAETPKSVGRQILVWKPDDIQSLHLGFLVENYPAKKNTAPALASDSNDDVAFKSPA